jgi:hypothetical protein
VGQNVRRLQIVSADSLGNAATTNDIEDGMGAGVGQTHCFQAWYRDPAGPCNSSFNTTGAVSLAWMP